MFQRLWLLGCCLGLQLALFVRYLLCSCCLPCSSFTNCVARGEYHTFLPCIMRIVCTTSWRMVIYLYGIKCYACVFISTSFIYIQEKCNKKNEEVFITLDKKNYSLLVARVKKTMQNERKHGEKNKRKRKSLYIEFCWCVSISMWLDDCLLNATALRWDKNRRKSW